MVRKGKLWEEGEGEDIDVHKWNKQVVGKNQRINANSGKIRVTWYCLLEENVGHEKCVWCMTVRLR